MNAKETYRKIAEALPHEVQAALLAIRDSDGDSAVIDEMYWLMPMDVYFCMLELGLITEFDESKRSGMQLTKTARHLVDFCTC